MKVDTLAEKLLFTTLRIETKGAASNSGTGTGFVFAYAHDSQQYPVVVTNKHVVQGAVTGWLTFHLSAGNGQPQLGSSYRLEITDFATAWHGHPDAEIDVTVMPLAPILDMLSKAGVSPFLQWIDRNITATPQLISELDALEDVVFIGYPNGIWDAKNSLPVSRRGTTATHIAVDFQGKKQFLLDASVFPGSSGSPVFLFSKGMFADRQGNTRIATRLAFLGIIAAVYFRQDINQITLVSAPTAGTPVAVAKQMIDLGIVFKAQVVLECIEDLLRVRSVNLSP
jgi:trypsin-like peptidase